MTLESSLSADQATESSDFDRVAETPCTMDSWVDLIHDILQYFEDHSPTRCNGRVSCEDGHHKVVADEATRKISAIF